MLFITIEQMAICVRKNGSTEFHMHIWRNMHSCTLSLWHTHTPIKQPHNSGACYHTSIFPSLYTLSHSPSFSTLWQSDVLIISLLVSLPYIYSFCLPWRVKIYMRVLMPNWTFFFIFQSAFITGQEFIIDGGWSL